MRAFEIRLNGEKLCLAGIGDDGVLSAIVNWVTGRQAADLFLHVGGLVSSADEHVAWIKQKKLSVGDSVEIKIVEASSVDVPVRRRRRDPAKDMRNRKKYVRAMAKQLGWKIQVNPKLAKSKSRKKR
jgi:hypothetical protein